MAGLVFLAGFIIVVFTIPPKEDLRRAAVGRAIEDEEGSMSSASVFPPNPSEVTPRAFDAGDSPGGLWSFIMTT